MSKPTDIPAPLLEFTLQNLGPLAITRFCGWDHAESQVWEVTDEQGRRAFLKAHRQPRKFEQELNAYQYWLPQLPAVTPTLLAVNEQSRALLLSAVPGDLVEKAKLARAEEHDLYRQAGAFLRQMHDLPFEDEDDVSTADALLTRLEAWAKRAEGVVDEATIDWVCACIEDVLPLTTDLKRVPCHRDYTARNWLVATGKLYIIDFEHARPDLWFADIERLYSEVWPGRPDLRAAFIEGYGRRLSADEESVLLGLAAFAGMGTVVWAREHGDTVFESRSWARLKRIKRILEPGVS